MSKIEIKNFWAHLQDKAHQENINKINKDNIKYYIDCLEKLFIDRMHLAVTEMPYTQINNKKILEIGCGTGGHSLFFASKGANVYSTDLTPERVDSSSQLINYLDTFKAEFKVCDAENLPYENNSFDIVYSNGVIHHTYDIKKAINEIHRVLKPKGKAFIMLYAKNSFMYYFNILLIKGFLLGYKKKYKKNWIGASTEWMSEKKQKIKNPMTMVLNKNELNVLFSEFKINSIRKNSFIFDHIPVIGKIISKFVGIFTGYNPAGIILYDKPWRNETKFEKFIGKYIGFCYNINITK